MKKLLSSIILFIFMFSLVFASDDSCVFNAGSSTWHCSNNSPGVNIRPGEVGNLTFYCCYTSPGLTGEEEFDLYIEVRNESRIQKLVDGEWIIEESDFPGSHFITDLIYPTLVNPNEDVEITIVFDLPEEHEDYAPGEVIHAITHVLLNSGSSFILNNVIDTRIIIPADWEPSLLSQIMLFVSDYYLFIGAGLLIVIILSFGGKYLLKKKPKKKKEDVDDLKKKIAELEGKLKHDKKE